LSEKGSVQEAINEFIQEYGPVEKTFSSGLFSPGSPLGLLLRELKTAWPFPLQVAYEKLRKSCGVFLLGMGSPNFAFSRPIRLKTKLGVLGLPFLTTKIS